MIELLVVVTLSTILMAMLLPFFEKSVSSAKYAVCTSNLKQIYTANQTRSISQGKTLTFPDAYTWQTEVESVVSEAGDLMCPMSSANSIKSNENFEFLSEPPPSIADQQLESDTKIFVFREKENFTLTSDVGAIMNPGIYGNPTRGANILTFDTTGNIEAGTTVDVFYFHFDGITANNGGELRHIILGSKVLGFIGKGSDLDATDSIFGFDDVQYTPQTYRGLDKGTHAAADTVELPENKAYMNYTTSKTVVNPNKGNDGMRVITAAGGGTNYGMNLEMPTYPSGNQIFLADSHIPVIDFDGEDDNDHTFDEAIAPRHEGKVNVVLTDGSVQLMDPSAIQPTSSFWRK